ncbi:hypothetical protein [Azospirillum agricola]|uniref:hypothetical protein n=1 Tax=Azospirillum agricola TaxID=1720247 RepID=UPI000A0F2693|nr:hypothetical protein [Azospirillum agricola]SMH54135.1 hypothetical protein SAMN02982994_3475 [Azospirillum lipoferum]
MIRLLSCIALIVAMVATMDRVLASALGDLLLRSDDRFMAVYRPPAPDDRPADVVVLGNSRADNHFPTEAMGNLACGSAINLGMGGAPTTISALLWEDYVERHGAPRLLLLEPTGVVDDPRTLADVPLLSHYSPRVDDFVRRTDHGLWLSNQAFHLMAFNSNQTIRLAAGLVRPSGDRTLSGVVPAPLRAQLASAPEERMEGFQPNWEAMSRIIESARAHGTRVAVVVTPYYPIHSAKLTNFDAFFAELKSRLPADVTFIDGRRTVQREELFMDALHINQDGVQAMFTALEPELRPLGNCPPTDAIASLSGSLETSRH